MSQQSKPRVYTFDEICESQDFNHEHEFVDKEALDEARKEIERKKQTLIERYDIINEYEEKELQWNEKLAKANALPEWILEEMETCRKNWCGTKGCECYVCRTIEKIEQHRGGK